MAFQVDKKADEITSRLSQKFPKLDASWLRDISEQSFVPTAEAMGQTDTWSFERDQSQRLSKGEIRGIM